MSAPDESVIDLALLGHPESYEHFGDLVLHERPDYGRDRLERYRATLERFFEWTPSYASGTAFGVRSPRGPCVTGSLVVCPFLPDTAQSVAGLARASAKTRQGCEVARRRGARIVALGGLTSVVLGARSGAIARDVGLAVTSGNALTAALALEQLDAVIQWLDWDLAERVVAVVGASGNIGRACVSALAGRVRGLVLIGRNVAKLEALRESLQARTTPMDLSSLVTDAARASVIVTATSAGRPLLRASALRPGTLVCDIGYPKTVEHDIDSGDVLVFQAGLAEMPFDLPLTHYTRLPNQRMMFGCFSEAMVLALSGRYESFSDYDTGITPEKLAGILALAREHGFAPAPPFSGGTRVDERRVERLCAAERSLR